MFRKEHHEVQVIHELKKVRNIYKNTEKKARQRNVAAKGICVMSVGGKGGELGGFLPWYPYRKVCDYELVYRNSIPSGTRLDRLRLFQSLTKNFFPLGDKLKLTSHLTLPPSLRTRATSPNVTSTHPHILLEWFLNNFTFRWTFYYSLPVSVSYCRFSHYLKEIQVTNFILSQ